MGNLILSSPDIMKLITETIQCGTNKLNAVLLATSSADPFYFKNFILTNINTPNFGAFLDGRIKINSVAGLEAIATAKAEILKCKVYNDFTSSICSTSPSMSNENGYIFEALRDDMSFDKLLERKTAQFDFSSAKKDAEEKSAKFFAEEKSVKAAKAEPEAEPEAAEAEPEELTTTRIKWDPEDYQQPSHLEFMWSRCGKGANLLWNSCGKGAENMFKGCGKMSRDCGRAAANFSKQCGKGAENMFNRCGKEAESMWKRCGKSLEKCDPTKKYGIAAALCFLTAYSMC